MHVYYIKQCVYVDALHAYVCLCSHAVHELCHHFVYL